VPALSDTTSNLIRIAVSLVGRERTRLEIGCTEEMFCAYERGGEDLPIDELTRLLAVIIAEQSAVLLKYRERLSNAKRLR
jgi:hypothetical protein